MGDLVGAPAVVPVGVNPPPLIDPGAFMSAPAPIQSAETKYKSVEPALMAGNTAVPTQVTAVPTGGPMFVEAGPGRPPMSLRTSAEVVEAAARVSRREAEASAREARAAERESALAVAESTALASRDARAANTMAVAAQAEATATAAVDIRASNLAVAANLDRRETAVRTRERALVDRERSTTAVAVAERERVAARREAAATMMADDARRRVDAMEAQQKQNSDREDDLETRERVLRDLAGLTKAREAACVAREAKLRDDEIAARVLFDSANASAAAAAKADASGRQRAEEVDGVASSLATVSADLTQRAAELARRETTTAAAERDAAERHAAVEKRDAAFAERERALAELHDTVERRLEAVAEAGTARAEALEAIQIALERREHAIETREAAADSGPNEQTATLFAVLEASRREVMETREVASTATDIARQLEEVVGDQRALLDVAAEDREQLMTQIEKLMKRVEEIEVMRSNCDSAESEIHRKELHDALAKCEAERDAFRSELEKAKRCAALTGHVAGSVGEYVRAIAVEKERYAALEKEKISLEQKILASPKESETQKATTTEVSSEVAAAREAAVALAEVATASVKAELDAVRLELQAVKQSAAAAKTASEAELNAVLKKLEAKKNTPPLRVSTPSSGNKSPGGSPRSPHSGGKPLLTPGTPLSSKVKRSIDAFTPKDLENTNTNSFSFEKRVETAERAARSLVERVRVSAERRVEVAARETKQAQEHVARLKEELAMCRAELDAAVAVAARAETLSLLETTRGLGKQSTQSMAEFSSRVARLDAAFAAACSTLEVLGETAAMAPVGGWQVVSETLEAQVMEGLRMLERLSGEEDNIMEKFSYTFGKAGSIPETRMSRAIRDVVAAVKDAAAVAATAEERV